MRTQAKVVFDTEDVGDNIVVDGLTHNSVVPPLLGNRHQCAAGQVDQPAEAILRIFCTQGFYGVILAILSAIFAKLAQNAIVHNT